MSEHGRIHTPEPDVRIAGSDDFSLNALTPKKHLVYAKAKNDANLKIGQFYLVMGSTSSYEILGVDDICVNYGVGEIGEDESLTSAERAQALRCQIPNTEVRDLVVLEPDRNADANCLIWVCKFKTISAKAVYGPSKGRRLKVCGTVKCRDPTNGAIFLTQVNVATVALRVTTKESQAKGARKRKYDSEVGPSVDAPSFAAFAAAELAASNMNDDSGIVLDDSEIDELFENIESDGLPESKCSRLEARIALLEEQVERLSNMLAPRRMDVAV